jgi:hypothetical protein
MDQQTKNIWTKEAVNKIVMKYYSSINDFTDPMPSYWDDDIDEVEDGLYICAEATGCQACSRRYPHSTLDFGRGCSFYKPITLDGMMGEVYHEEKKVPDTFKFRRYFEETEDAGQNPHSQTNRVAQGQLEI